MTRLGLRGGEGFFFFGEEDRAGRRADSMNEKSGIWYTAGRRGEGRKKGIDDGGNEERLRIYCAL